VTLLTGDAASARFTGAASASTATAGLPVAAQNGRGPTISFPSPGALDSALIVHVPIAR
jgi:hypothetical protein